MRRSAIGKLSSPYIRMGGSWVVIPGMHCTYGGDVLAREGDGLLILE